MINVQECWLTVSYRPLAYKRQQIELVFLTSGCVQLSWMAPREIKASSKHSWSRSVLCLILGLPLLFNLSYPTLSFYKALWTAKHKQQLSAVL